MPLDTPVELRFDRFILPRTAVRQSIRVHTGADSSASSAFQPVYDVVERVVTFRLNGQLRPGLLYQVDLLEPGEQADGSGFRAFDGAPLESAGSAPLHFSFRTARAAPVAAPPVTPPTCNAALDVLANAGCAVCHRGPKAPLGLRLDSAASLRETALSRVSREAEGPVSSQIIVGSPRFGTGMALVEPGSPSSSYLVYKLLAKAENYGDSGPACATVHRVPLPEGQCLAPDAAELARLSNWFVRLDPMPPGSAGLGSGITDLRTLTDYIRAGADTASCTD